MSFATYSLRFFYQPMGFDSFYFHSFRIECSSVELALLSVNICSIAREYLPVSEVEASASSDGLIFNFHLFYSLDSLGNDDFSEDLNCFCEALQLYLTGSSEHVQ